VLAISRALERRNKTGVQRIVALNADHVALNEGSLRRRVLDMVSIRERPAEAEDRAVPGHWEGDLLTGASDTHIVTLVERHSRFTMLVKLPRKDTTTVVAALAKHIRKLPEQLRRSLTWGPRQGDVWPQTLHGCHQRAGLLL